ncbi:MAG: hypothetical protein NZ853_11350 [Leptospiraceae bacterium]|nr:hypothetical protein [Leptospiraceae bacterium]MDW7977150.1 hypothetical protein [Leptospiraceae bacterium]
MKVSFRFYLLTLVGSLILSCLSCYKIKEPPPLIPQVEQVETGEKKSHCPTNEEEFLSIFSRVEAENIVHKAQLTAPHYPASNERRIDLFYPYVKNLGGGYIGVGTDQNFTFIAWARSDYAYLVDFDWMAVYVNRLHILFFQESPSFLEFRKFWTRAHKNQTLNLIKNKIPDPKEQETYVKAYHYAQPHVNERLSDLFFMTKNFGFSSFHNQQSDFDYIKSLIEKKRIHPMLGDINGTKTLKSIGEASKSLCIPIRILYLSNAEEYYRYPQTFRENVKSLFFDEQSIILRTVTTGAKTLSFPDGEKYSEIPFHYNIQKIQNLVEWFQQEKLWIFTMLKYRKNLQKGFSILETYPYTSHSR